MSVRSGRVGELRSNGFLTDSDTMWMVDFSDVANTHPLSELVLKHLIELTMPKGIPGSGKARKRRMKQGTIAEAAEGKVPTTNADVVQAAAGPSGLVKEATISRLRVYRQVVFVRTEMIFNDGTREVTEQTHQCNLNP